MATSSSVDSWIAIERANYINSNLLTGVTGGFLICCVVAVTFWDVASQQSILAWLVANFALATYRLTMWRSYSKQVRNLRTANRCMFIIVLGSGLSGCLWGMTVLFLMPPDQVLYHVVLVFTISMMGVAAMFSFGVHYPVFLSFFVPSMFSAVVGLLVQGTRVHVELAVGIVIFVLVALRLVAAFNHMFVRTLELRFENVELVRQLTVEKEFAEAANLAKSRFLAAASHDLRQPMHALNLYLGTLAGLELPEAARVMLTNVRLCADTMDDLFRALLDISRLDAGAVQPAVTTFAIADTLARLQREFEPQARAKGLDLRVVTSRRHVRSDPELVERILRNFTANALNYTERGTILIGCRARGALLRIAVYDTGPGIAPDHQKSVFEEFFQIGNPQRDRSRGIGLGLAIVDRLSRLLDAPVTLSSQLGRGSMFAIDLPLSSESVAALPARARAPDHDVVAHSMVVVVDDEEAILDAMRLLLEQWGCEVVAARSGQDALTQLESVPRPPDALLCDFRLAEGEDGIDVVARLREEFNEDIPALILTGDTGPERLQQIAASGLTALHKPVNANTLRDALATILAPAHPAV